ncbi:pro-sigmaK processing inhibitor BofA family protein, partial [[Clostridium] scindens]
FFVNEFLASKGISAQVGMNPITFLTSGVFGIPGVALLYGITFYQIL